MSAAAYSSTDASNTAARPAATSVPIIVQEPVAPIALPVPNMAGKGIILQCELDDATLTVMHACEAIDADSMPVPMKMTKRFYLDEEGALQKLSYSGATFYDATRVYVDGIMALGSLLTRISRLEKRNAIIIRGVHQEAYSASSRRTDSNFAEHPAGSYWVMLDIDGVQLPDGMSPHSVEGIIWLRENKLPLEFRGVTCFYQFSSSAGICNADGTLLKTGLCAHLFFFLGRRVQGEKLAAYLRSFCMASNFYTIDNNKGGVATLTHGIDPAPIRSAVQAHYVAHPIVGRGVVCLLAETERDGFISGDRDTVHLPVIADDIVATAYREQNRLLTGWKEANGYTKAVLQVHTTSGIATTTYYKPTVAGVARTGRVMINAVMSSGRQRDDICTLVLEDENSPGSWFVRKGTPHLARRYDGTTIPLKEFSESAYAHVRDVLAWLIDIPHRTCQLTAETGFLPAIGSFATARHSLILAPTGSGKTYRMTELMAAKSSTLLVIYVAQTIPLVNQMAADLTARNTPHHHYNGFNYYDTPRTGIFLTTNESLPKILRELSMIKYVLVVDEFHRALDDFTRSDQRFSILKSAITQAQQVVYMTGTLTTIQRGMLSETVGGILGKRMTEAEYCCYEFPSVKQNPLHITEIRNFQSDVIGLVEQYAELRSQGQPIPRTVLIMNTSRMEVFNQIFEEYGLLDQVKVVSRPENTHPEIEAARTATTRPILVASPLFSIGLNFECEPEVLWCRFDHLEADTSQINQTINRANRGAVACAVRIYAGGIDKTPIYFPPKVAVKAELAEIIAEESDFINSGYDMPMLLDRLAYKEYRRIEQNTNKSLGSLVHDAAFQNYVVAELTDVPARDETKHRTYGEFKQAANVEYDNRIIARCELIQTNKEIFFLLEDAKALERESRENHRAPNPRTEREIEDDELAIILRICNLEEPAKARKVSMSKLHLLFGTREPWVSERYKAINYQRSKSVAAEKVQELIYLVEVIGWLASGELNGESLAVKLSRDKRLQNSFLALAGGEREFLSIQKSFKKLAELREEYRQKRSAASKGKLDKFVKLIVVELLGEIGIFFEVDPESRHKSLNMKAPVVPATWDIPGMLVQLSLFAELLAAFPDGQPLEWGWSPCHFVYSAISNCAVCKSFYRGRCLRGNAVDFSEWGIDDNEVDIGGYATCQERDVRRVRRDVILAA